MTNVDCEPADGQVASEHADPTTARPRGFPWAAARFVVLFLIGGFAVMAGGRYAIGTPPMDWYLFQVARHTAWLLGIVGDSSRVENPQVYEGREAHIRAQMAAWVSGVDADDPPSTVDVSTQPLTSYEAWRFRAARVQHDVASERSYLADLAPLERSDAPDPAALADHARRAVEQLERSMRRPGAVAELSRPEVATFVRDAKAALDDAQEKADPADPGFKAWLDDLLTNTESLRQRQAEIVRDRIASLRQRQEKIGPLVRFVARKADPESADPAKRHDVSFSFHLVADCGAIPSMAIFVCALLAFPAPWRKRLVGALIGVPLLYAVNVLRLTCLAEIGAWTNGGKWFEFAHEYVWQGIYLVFVVALWLAWAEFIVRPEWAQRTDP